MTLIEAFNGTLEKEHSNDPYRTLLKEPLKRNPL